MSNQNNTPSAYIEGRDFPAEHTITILMQHFATAGIEFIVSEPYQAAPHVWWQHLAAKNTPAYSNGKGSSPQAALASALAEFAERLGSGYLFADYLLDYSSAIPVPVFKDEVWLGSNEVQNNLKSLYQSIVDFPYDTGLVPEQWLQDANALCDFKPQNALIRCLPFVHIHDQDKKELFPVNVIWNHYASNGMAIGTTVLESRIQASSEILERCAKYRILSEGSQLPKLHERFIPSWWNECKTEFDNRQFSVRFLDAGLGLDWPVVMILLIDQSSGRCAVSFGAHPNPGIACSRTITELLQGRNLDNLDLEFPSIQENDYASPGNLESHFINSTGAIPLRICGNKADFSPSSWNTSTWKIPSTRQEEWNCIISLLDKLYSPILIREKIAFGLSLSHIIIPGISEIYPMEEIWDGNNSKLYRLRQIVVNPQSIDPNTWIEITEWLEQEVPHSEYQKSVIEALSLAPETTDSWLAKFWKNCSLGTLLVLLLLKTKRNSDAKEFILYHPCPNDIHAATLWQQLLYLINGETQSESLYHENEYKIIETMYYQLKKLNWPDILVFPVDTKFYPIPLIQAWKTACY